MNSSEVAFPSVKREHLTSWVWWGLNRATWAKAQQVHREQLLLCVPFQLCEDLFSRVNKNESAQLSYSVEVSLGLGGAPGRGGAAEARLWAVSGLRQPRACLQPHPLLMAALGR